MSVAIDDTNECVSMEGRAEALGAGVDRDALIEMYVDKYAEPDARQQMAGFVASHAMWLVRPERAFGVIEREEEFSARATKWVW